MKLVVLDRDGVINRESDGFIRRVEDWVPIPNSLEAIARLYHAGFRISVASNQSGLARGLFSIDDLNAMHRKMHRELSVHSAQIEAIFFCPHGPEDGCRCRKPEPGLLVDISERFQTNMAGIPVIGDSFRDIQSAWRVDAFPMLVLTGKGRRTLEKHRSELRDVPVFEDLSAAADALIRT